MMPCPVCNSAESKDYLFLQGYKYKKCGKCSLIFLEKVAPPEGAELYNNEYIEKRGHDATGSYIAKAKETTAAYYFSLLEKYATKGNVLEIGCSTGMALKAARARGWNIYGIETNRAAVAIAQDLLKTDTIKSGYLTKDSFPDDFFSAVVMFDVIEHVKEPLELMNIIGKKLRPLGLVLLITPNAGSLSANILKEKWPHLFPEHVCLYSRRSMYFLLNESGFKILRSGWAVKFINTDILRRHINCHPRVFLSAPLALFFKKAYFLDKIVFPFNIGEMYVCAQKQ
ncbi:MAG: class I SAM-dependent methyltransferase [Candidatus Omnitrophica bacterium]|jgi:2-polyprenyl-3-methyl-5-hydroxy-6-metoxy-1,4-benzoquinol methylase|nr:class I SAM-dependent methyltransferase [Candidatus Omnitrophota bacterium]